MKETKIKNDLVLKFMELLSEDEAFNINPDDFDEYGEDERKILIQAEEIKNLKEQKDCADRFAKGLEKMMTMTLFDFYQECPSRKKRALSERLCGREIIYLSSRSSTTEELPELFDEIAYALDQLPDIDGSCVVTDPE